MILEMIGDGDAGMLVDEQTLSGDPRAGTGGTPANHWFPGWSDVYPAVYVTGMDGQGVYVAFGGVIEGTTLVNLVNSLTLMSDDISWPEHDKQALRHWFREFLSWLLESQHGKDEASCHNNHGSWYCTQVVSYAKYCGAKDIAESFLRDNVPARIAKQIEPDGSFPEELVRADCFHYTEFVLASFVNLALLAESMGINIWGYETEDGRGIKKVIEWVMPYFEQQHLWKYRSIALYQIISLGWYLFFFMLLRRTRIMNI